MTGDSLISIPTLHGVRTALMSQIHGYKIKNDELGTEILTIAPEMAEIIKVEMGT